jgi:hypothetical protein
MGVGNTYETDFNADFNNMLKRYMPYQLLDEETKKRSWFWGKVMKDENWFRGRLEVPFYGAEASSLAMGNLVGATDISESKPVLGYVDTFRELWGAMKFYEMDLDLHGDMEASFLKIYPDQLNKFIGRMSERISLILMNGYLDKLTATGGTNGTGVLDVNHPERFTIGERIHLYDGTDAAANTAEDHGYVIAIDMANKRITVSDTRGGSASATLDNSTNINAYTVANNARIDIQGGSPTDSTESRFTSLRSQVLSSANGGSASILNQTKTAYPYLQAQQHDGSSVTAANILDSTFDFFFDTLNLGKGNPTEIVMDFTNFKNCAKALEVSRNFTVTDKKAGYGWRSISVLGSEGEMDITAVREQENDVMFIQDWRGMKFHGSHFFDRKRHLDGNEFYLTRSAQGYDYIVDIRFFGDLVVSAPSHQGIVHSISY